MNGVVLNPTLATFALGSVLSFSLVIWFLVRKRRYRIWVPILRVIDLESRILPKLTLTHPPWFPFVCFLLTALLLLLLSLEPSKKVFTPFQPNQTHVHVFFDMSPSVSALGGIDAYIREVETLFQSLDDQGRVTFSTSHSEKVFDYTGVEDAKTIIGPLGFHSEGLKLGHSLRKHLEQVGDVNVLIIFSDSNQFTWADLNWNYLEDEVEVKRVPFIGEGEAKSNFYINQVKPVPSQGRDLVEWDVEIIRSGEAGLGEGVLRVEFEGKELYLGGWQIPQDRSRVDLRVRWSSEKIISKNVERNPSEPIIWKLETSNSEHLKLDNTFRTYPSGIKREILLISDHGGELFLDDPAHHLKITLELLGFRVHRVDRLYGQELLNSYPVRIVLAGIDREIDLQCPKITSGEKSQHQAELTGASKRITWLSPLSNQVDWGVLCKCFARFSQIDDNPEFCQGVETKNQYLGVLKSVGAKQVGGEVGNIFGSIAWHYKLMSSKNEVLAFVVPLRPSLTSGVTYSTLPTMVRVLSGWQQLSFKEDLEFGHWPRIQSISEDEQGGDRKLVSNVPVGESSLNDVAAEILPPQWDPNTEMMLKNSSTKRTQDDPLPWLRFILIGILAISALEGIGQLIRLVYNLASKRKGAASLLLAAIFFGGADDASAVVKLNLLGFPKVATSVTRLAREVSSRTSIEMDIKADLSSTYSVGVLNEPWIWAKGTGDLVDQRGLLRSEIAFWVKKGGLLIVEEAGFSGALDALTKGNIFRLGKDDGWKAIPPDHELMRSFHLLDSLPTCNGLVWRGFHFDGRLAILAIPGNFISLLSDKKDISACKERIGYERMTRIFVNILMVALATDYKKDQIHLPEILKRLR